jgi:hypothetical protein
MVLAIPGNYSSSGESGMSWNRVSAALGLAMAILSPAAGADEERGAVSCEQLRWAAQVLEANPDIARACQGVYELDGVLYAQATIEVTRVQGNTMRFRTLRTDGTKGPTRSVKLPASWRVNLDGRQYRLGELVAGQQLDIFLPEDRFALAVISDGQQAPIEATAIED